MAEGEKQSAAQGLDQAATEQSAALQEERVPQTVQPEPSPQPAKAKPAGEQKQSEQPEPDRELVDLPYLGAERTRVQWMYWLMALLVGLQVTIALQDLPGQAGLIVRSIVAPLVSLSPEVWRGVLVLVLGLAVVTMWISISSIARGDLPERPDVLVETARAHQRANTALIVIHGIGQQERYETMASLITGMDALDHSNYPVQVSLARPGHAPRRVVVPPAANASISDVTGLQVVTWFQNDEHSHRKLDVFEGYWAPLAQRQRSFAQVMNWVWSMGLLTVSRFGERRPTAKPGMKLVEMDQPSLGQVIEKGKRELRFLGLVASMTLGVLVLGVTAFLFSLKFGLGLDYVPTPLLLLQPGQLAALVKMIPGWVWVVAVALAFGGFFWGRERGSVGHLRREWKRADIALNLYADEPESVSANRAHKRKVLVSLNQRWFRQQAGGAVALAALAFLVTPLVQDPGDRVAAVLVALTILMVERVWGLLQEMVADYFGDVVTYVNTSENAATYVARKNVQAKVKAVIESVLAAEKSKGEPQYENIVLAGHSLGSVVGHDVLLQLYNEADASLENREERLNALRRIKAWVTFGSPLRKTQAFFEAKTQPNATLRVLRQAADARVFVSPRPEEVLADEGDVPNIGIRWYNFWELDDIVANPFRDRYPVWHEARITLGPRERSPLVTHSDYWRAAAFLDPVLRIVRALQEKTGLDGDGRVKPPQAN